MVGSFYGLNVMRRAMQAQQQGLLVTGQNVANANTKGYSRQEVFFAASDPYDILTPQGIGQLGTGVTQESVVRYRSQFLDLQYREYNAALGYYDNSGSTMDQIQHIINEPSDTGISEALNGFWAAVHDLSNRPADADTRVKLIQTSQVFLDQANTTYQSLSQLRSDLNNTLQTRVAQINEMAKQVGSLNHQIQVATAQGQIPNDLMDRRDNLVDSLAKELGVQVAVQNDGQVNLFTGGMALVTGNSTNDLQVTSRASDGFYDVTWVATGQPVRLPSNHGELGALIYGRDTQVPTYQGYVNTLVKTVTGKFNAQHLLGADASGATGINFFNIPGTVNRPSDISISATVLGNPTKVAAAAAPIPPATTVSANDNTNALALYSLSSSSIMSFGSGPLTTSQGYYQAAVTQMGLEARDSIDRAATLTAQVSAADRQRGSVQGVSLDEEMTKLIQFQQAYNAAARMVTAIDTNLDTIISKMGLVGR